MPEDQEHVASEVKSMDSTKETLDTELIEWEREKIRIKRLLLAEVITLVQQDRSVNESVARIAGSMAGFADRDSAQFWRDRSTSPSAEGRFQFPFPPPFPFPFPIPPIPPIPFPGIPLPPSPGDVFGQITDLIKAEKKFIQDLLLQLLG